MSAKSHSSYRWLGWSVVGILLCLLVLTSVVRLRTYFMTRKIQAVLHGLAQIQIDQTTEEQALKTVPYLTQSKWQHSYYVVEISNEPDRFSAFLIGYGIPFPSSLEQPPLLSRIAYWLGYRYLDFDAGVLMQDGKVSQVGYGLSQQWVRPKVAGYIVSAKSIHGVWISHHQPLGITDLDDESPQYRPSSDRGGIHVTYTYDAPAELTKRVFQLNLECFWNLNGCYDPREIAPTLWEDSQAIKDAALQRVRAGKCPDSVVEGRMRYLPDVSVFLLEVTGSRRINVNEDGYDTEDWFTDYKLKEVIRGRDPRHWQHMRFARTIPSPLDPTQRIANQTWPQTKIGSQALFFGNMNFYSCRIIPATPSALEIARKTPVAQKRPEDAIQRGLL
jgi:hypothetical protein